MNPHTLLELFTTLSSLTPMGYSIPIFTKIHVVFLGSVSSFFHSALCYPSVWLPQRSVLQRMRLGRTQPLRLHPWISLLSCSQPLSPHRFTQPIFSLPGLNFFCLLVKTVPPRLSCRFPKATRAQISTFHPSIIH